MNTITDNITQLTIFTSTGGEDSCDTAFQIAKCYFKAYPEVRNQKIIIFHKNIIGS